MKIRYVDGIRPRDVTVDVHDPDATVADLVEALEPGQPMGPILVDDRFVPTSTPLDRAHVVDGATVTRAVVGSTGSRCGESPKGGRMGLEADLAGAQSGVLVRLSSGLDAGRRFWLAPGDHLIGRTTVDPSSPASVAIDDPTVSRRHALLNVDRHSRVRVTDLVSSNGTWIDARQVGAGEVVPAATELRCGAARLIVTPAGPATSSSRPTSSISGGTVPRLRSPREQPSPLPRIDLPPPPEGPSMVTPLGAVAMLASVAMAGVMVITFGSWSYAAFALLGPLLMAANAIDSRRRTRRVRRRNTRRRTAQLNTLEAELGDLRIEERRRRGQRFMGVHDALDEVSGLSPTCWNRRPDHYDAYEVRVGFGEGPYEPPLSGVPKDWPEDVAALAAAFDRVRHTPVGVCLDPGRAIALVGTRGAIRALARAMVVQATVAHGPADLEVVVLADAGAAPHWNWCCWLPHCSAPGVGSLLAGDRESTSRLVETVLEQRTAGTDGRASRSASDRRLGGWPRRLVIIDDSDALRVGRSAPRRLIRSAMDPAADLIPVVLVSSAEHVPAECRVVVHVSEDGSLSTPIEVAVGPAVVCGTSISTSTEVARAMARFDDPEVDDPGRGLPDSLPLLALLGPQATSHVAVLARWRAGGHDPRPRAVIGRTGQDAFELDLTLDGPHVLVAGTTGSGKSELLRTVVASLAATASPDHLTFVLIDFKGGSAFDACARLPHTTGLVTDLDQQLAARALRCLEAELRHREQRLRAAGASDISALRCDAGQDPLPRLVVVVDEFATLAGQLPDFMSSLVGVAQRGRSLGIHLLLATQRPSGVVSEDIRANVSLRIALRVQSTGDSTDVIGVPDAAALAPTRPGRALVRVGPTDLQAVQVAHVSCHSSADAVRPVSVRSMAVTSGTGPGDGGSPSPSEEPPDRPQPGSTSASDLERLVDAMTLAWSTLDRPEPRAAWPQPLPARVDWPLPSDLLPRASVRTGQDHPAPVELLVGVADDPDNQCIRPFGWSLDHGSLLAVGLPGSGTEALAAAVVLAAADRWPPNRCHIHVIDLGRSSLAGFASLPHVGAVIGGEEHERQRRLVADLHAELTRRSTASTGVSDPARRILVIHGIGSFRRHWDDLEPTGTWEGLVDIATRGSGVGIHVLATAEAVQTVPHRLAAVARQRLAFRLADVADHVALGTPAAAVPDLSTARCLSVDDQAVVQIAEPVGGIARGVAHIARRWAEAPSDHHGRPDALADPVEVLPDRIDLAAATRARRHVADAVEAQVGSSDGALSLVIGLADDDLGPARLILPDCGHALVAGPPGSGRTTALGTIASAAAGAGFGVVVVSRDAASWHHLGRRSGVAAIEVFSPDDWTLTDRLALRDDRVLLVDDADLTDGSHAALAAATADRRPGSHVVVAARSDRLRGMYGHWIREVRADRRGILLIPDLDLDGELMATRLPRRPTLSMVPGRGWLTGSGTEGWIQVAQQ